MRTVIATLADSMALAAVSLQAAPLPPAKANPAELSDAPAFELVAQGCGWGWHHVRRWDRWGRRHWGRCVPNW
jgi:hypothetical protein